MTRLVRKLSIAAQAICVFVLVLFVFTEVNEFLGFIFMILGAGWAVTSLVEILQ